MESAGISLRLIKGSAKKVGHGLVWTWVKVQDPSGIPNSIGITLTCEAMQGLPADHDSSQAISLNLKLIDGSPHHNFEYELVIPAVADRTAYSHIGFNWNPEGHGLLPGVFCRLHFDMHFKMATPAHRHSTTNGNRKDIHI